MKNQIPLINDSLPSLVVYPYMAQQPIQKPNLDDAETLNVVKALEASGIDDVTIAAVKALRASGIVDPVIYEITPVASLNVSTDDEAVDSLVRMYKVQGVSIDATVMIIGGIKYAMAYAFSKTNKTQGKPMTEQNNTLIAGYSDTAEFERLEDGMYEAVIAGIVTRNFADYNDKSKLVTKHVFMLQVTKEGATYYLKYKPVTAILGEKSNFMVFLAGATGATLQKIKEKYPHGFPLENLVGVPVQVVVTTVTGKDGREYAELANVLKAKKGQKTKIVPDAIPAYLVRGAVSYHLGEGLTVKEDTKVTAPAAAPSVQPFGGATRGASPSIPAGATITQNTNAAAFMGTAPANLQVTHPAPEPAPAAAVEDDDADLPF